MYKVRELERGFLAIMPHPQGEKRLTYEIAGLSTLGVTDLVSLLEPHEETELGLSGEKEAAQAVGINFQAFPLPDRKIPPDLPAFRELALSLATQVQNGQCVAVHCRAGIGRSGLLVAAILVRLGENPTRVFAMVSQARGISVPDTKEQRAWFTQISHEFATGA